MRKMFRRLFIVALSGVMCVSASSTVNAAKDNSSVVELGDYDVNVNELAEKYNVDADELRESIENGKDEAVASPFSNLETSEKADGFKFGKNILRKDPDAPGGKVWKANQDSTAYVAKKGSLTASGKAPSVGMCAMHTNVTTRTGATTKDVVRFGTPIYMDKSVNVNGKLRSIFYVEDRGAGNGRTKYWIDIYFGNKTNATYKAAINYGIRKVSYYYYK